MNRSRYLAGLSGPLVAAVTLTAAAAPKPSVELTLPEALALAVEQGPALAACSEEVRALKAESFQAGRRPNPSLAAEIENFGGSGEMRGLGDAEMTISLSHVIELGGKRARRLEEARLARDVAAWDCEVVRIDVLTGTHAAFVVALSAQRRVALADTLVSLAEEVLAAVKRRVKAGGVSPVEERRARLALEIARVDRDRTERAVKVAHAALSAAWGEAGPHFTSVVGDLESAADLAVPDLDAIRARGTVSPEVARWTAELERREAALASDGAAGRSDLSIQAGVRRRHGTEETGFVVGVEMPLPVFDRNRDAIDAARSRVRGGEEERRAAEGQVDLALATAHAALVDAREEAVALRDRVLPEAAAALFESREAYLSGRVPLTDVLDAQRTAFELKRRFVDALAETGIRAAQLERVLGEPLEPETDGRSGE